jgi:hypothetical protein
MVIVWKLWSQSNAKMRIVLTSVVLGLLTFAVPAQASSDDVLVYEVKKGDTLIDLGAKYFMQAGDYRVVQKANNIRNDRTIPVGTKLRIARSLLKFRNSTAQIASFRGNVVHVQRGAQNAVTKGANLGEGSTLRTAGSSFATFTLENGSRISLPSNSDLKIVRLRHYLIDSSLDYDFEVGRGAAKSKVTPMTNGNDRYVVKTPKAVSAVRGTDFQSRYDEAAGSDFSEVSEGALAVTLPGGAHTDMPAGNGLAVKLDGAVIKERLIAPVELPTAGQLQKDQFVRFSAPEQAVSNGLRVTLASDASFIDVVAEASFTNGTATFEGIEDGNYFARFRAVSASGIEGMPATYAFKRRLNSVTAGGGKGDFGYVFKWAGQGRGRLLYHFQLFKDKSDGVAVVDEAGLSATEISLSDLPAGDYYWRVASVQYVDGEVSTNWTPFEKLIVSAQ